MTVQRPDWGAIGTLALIDSNGAVMASTPIRGSNTALKLPDVGSGTYTVTADVDLGPYQGALHAGTSVKVRAPVTLQVTPKVIKPGVATQVTVHAISRGAPVADLAIDIGHGEVGSGNTNVNGDYVSTVTIPSQVVPIRPEQDADRAGNPLQYYDTVSMKPASSRGRKLILPAGLNSFATRGVAATELHGITLSGDVLRVLPASAVPVTGPTNVTLDASLATSTLVIEGHDAKGNSVGSVDTLLQSGSLFFWVQSRQHQQVLVSPSSYEVNNAQLTLEDPKANERWMYFFSGHAPFQVVGSGITKVVVGGPLTASVGPVKSVNVAGDRIEIRGTARDSIGLVLTGAWVSRLSDWTSLRTVGSRVEIKKGVSYSVNLDYSNTTAVWNSPRTLGSYTLRYLFKEAGPYGVIPSATGAIELVRKYNPGRAGPSLAVRPVLQSKKITMLA